MKTLRCILLSLVIVAAAGLLGYQGFVENNLTSGDLTKGILIIAGALLSMFKPRRTRVTNKKTLYQKAYSEFIQNAFSDDPKLEKRFYNAIHAYNQNKPAAAITQLEKLRKECQRTADLRAVTVFMALCLDEMQQYDAAIRQYDAALKLRESTTLHSNMGLCYQRLGKMEEAEAAYNQAIQCDPQNAFAYNNLSALYFRLGDYDTALKLAQKALEINPKMTQALNTATICSALNGCTEDYEKYYRQAVANGSDGAKLKKVIKQLDPAL